MSQDWAIPIPATDIIKDARTKINDALDNLRSNSHGSTEPTAGDQPYANQFWMDSSGGGFEFFKIRNKENTAWINTNLDLDLLRLRSGSIGMAEDVNLPANFSKGIINLANSDVAFDGLNKEMVQTFLGIEKGDYAGSNQDNRIINFDNTFINPIFLLIVENATNSTISPYVWINGLPRQRMISLSTGIFADDKLRDIGIGFFKLSGDDAVNGNGRSFSYLVYGNNQNAIVEPPLVVE